MFLIVENHSGHPSSCWADVVTTEPQAKSDFVKEAPNQANEDDGKYR